MYSFLKESLISASQIFTLNESLSRSLLYGALKGFDPHNYKAEVLKRNGVNQPVSRYDMYVHKSGEILLRRKGSSDFIRTGEYVK